MLNIRTWFFYSCWLNWRVGIFGDKKTNILFKKKPPLAIKIIKVISCRLHVFCIMRQMYRTSRHDVGPVDISDYKPLDRLVSTVFAQCRTLTSTIQNSTLRIIPLSKNQFGTMILINLCEILTFTIA